MATRTTSWLGGSGAGGDAAGRVEAPPGAIPDGLYRCGLGPVNRWVSGAGKTCYEATYRILEGESVGREVACRLWDTPEGQWRLREDMAALGHSHPEELCVARSREYVVFCRVRTDPTTGETGVTYIRPLPPPVAGPKSRPDAPPAADLSAGEMPF